MYKNHFKFSVFTTIFITVSLENMLSNHGQSMFEFLAPRRGGHVQHHQAQARHNVNNEGGYKDMVY